MGRHLRLGLTPSKAANRVCRLCSGTLVSTFVVTRAAFHVAIMSSCSRLFWTVRRLLFGWAALGGRDGPTRGPGRARAGGQAGEAAARGHGSGGDLCAEGTHLWTCDGRLVVFNTRKGGFQHKGPRGGGFQHKGWWFSTQGVVMWGIWLLGRQSVS